MTHLERLNPKMSVSLKPDEDGFTGRECPAAGCESYFKVQIGTGLKGSGLPCHCPYCGHSANHSEFHTKEQIEYARSVVANQITQALLSDLKELEFDSSSTGGFGISLKVSGEPYPISYYREKALETELTCDKCTLRYMIYGMFAYCPDCGVHNSIQILQKNLELVKKLLELASAANPDLAERLINNALEDCVSAFDGYGREICRINASKATNASKAERISFQNLRLAKESMALQFGVDVTDSLSGVEWDTAVRGFQKRHVLSHKMGVIDADYISKSGDTNAIVGRKMTVKSTEVLDLVEIIHKLAEGLSTKLGAVRV